MLLRDIYTILQIISVVILTIELFYVLLQKPSNLQRDLILILFSLIFASVFYIVELQAKSLEAAMIGCKLGYLAKPFGFLATLYLLLDYSHIKVNKTLTLVLICYFIVLSIFVITNGLEINGVELHRLYYPISEYDPTRLGSPLYITHGPVWYIFMVSSFLLYFGFVGLTIYEFKYAKTTQVKRMTIWLFFMVFFSVLGLALFIAGVTKGYDSTLLGVLLGSFCMIFLFAKYKIFDSLTLAKEAAFNDSNNQLIVLDAKSNISYFTDNAYIFAPELKEFLTHQKENNIIKRLELYEVDKPIFINNKVYKLTIKDYMNPDNTICYGRSYSFIDSTEDYDYQERLKKEVAEATNEVRQMQKEILISIANIIEARDGCTGTHIKNVSKYAVATAIALSKKPKYKHIINDGFLTMLDKTMPLHDIGKIKIPDAILQKPGKLTEEEFEIIKTHTTLGAEVIKTAISNVEKHKEIEMAHDIALYHHERYDGAGYPVGLKGEEIPLSARIAAVADVYDALRMERTYKPAYDKEKSLAIIKEESGTHFDSEVVEAFLSVIDNVDK